MKLRTLAGAPLWRSVEDQMKASGLDRVGSGEPWRAFARRSGTIIKMSQNIHSGCMGRNASRGPDGVWETGREARAGSQARGALL